MGCRQKRKKFLLIYKYILTKYLKKIRKKLKTFTHGFKFNKNIKVKYDKNYQKKLKIPIGNVLPRKKVDFYVG